MPAHSTSQDDRDPRRVIVGDLLMRQQWHLVDVDEMMAQLRPLLAPDDRLEILRRKTVHEYSKILYDACCQRADPRRREQAFGELHRYLHRATYNRWPVQADDITQQALLIVTEQLDKCRHPGAFLSFALFKSMDAMKRLLREEDRWRMLTAPLVDWLIDDNRKTPLHSVLIREQVAEVEAALSQMPERFQQVLLLKFEFGMNDGQIAEALGITVNYVRVLRNRARHDLRARLAAAWIAGTVAAILQR